MSDVETKFLAKIHFHFDSNSREKFVFGPNLMRAVPVKFDFVDGLNSLRIFVDQESEFLKGSIAEFMCDVVSENLIEQISIGSKGQLWDSSYFAGVEILEKVSANTNLD